MHRSTAVSLALFAGAALVAVGTAPAAQAAQTAHVMRPQTALTGQLYCYSEQMNPPQIDIDCTVDIEGGVAPYSVAWSTNINALVYEDTPIEYGFYCTNGTKGGVTAVIRDHSGQQISANQFIVCIGVP